MLRPNFSSQAGNVLIIILIAIALIAALTAAIQGTSNTANIDRESLILKRSELISFTSELERAIVYIQQNGISETDIRFSHPELHSDYGDLSADIDKTDQVFAREGGGAQYRVAPSGINDGSAWEFYGHTSLPETGSTRADLLAVLPNVTEGFCDIINDTVGYTQRPQDSGICIHNAPTSRFNNSTQFQTSPNQVTTSTFSASPVKQGCVQCDDDNLHFFYVLMTR